MVEAKKQVKMLKNRMLALQNPLRISKAGIPIPASLPIQSPRAREYLRHSRPKDFVTRKT